MPTTDQLSSSALYRDIITEIRIRIHAIDLSTSNKIALPPQILKEFCYLQFRMMIELIALGCLIAHGDIRVKKQKLEKMWEADKIIRELEALNPDFYPVAVHKMRTDFGFHVEPKPIQPLPKAELISLYHKCGAVLHRGSTKKLLSKKHPIQIHYPDITNIAQKFRDLISDHMISLYDGSMRFMCQIINENGDEQIQVAIAESQQDGAAL